jgi:Ca2+-binding RTX toxin-like protein
MSHPVDVIPPFPPHTPSRVKKTTKPEKGKGVCVMKMKRRAIVLLTTMAVVLVVGSGVALAATTINCPNDTAQGSPSTYLYCNGTEGADTMSGSELADYMLGMGGEDTMHGNGGRDFLKGENGSDHIYGDAGNDVFLIGGANDASVDYVHGGSGDDSLFGGFALGGVDRVYGEGGNDTIDTGQRHNFFGPVTKEIIDCGGGASDEVYFDKGLDVTTNCEIKHAS